MIVETNIVLSINGVPFAATQWKDTETGWCSISCWFNFTNAPEEDDG